MSRTLAAACLSFLSGSAFSVLAVASTDGALPIEFLRGDANADGRLDVSDPILTLQNLFLDGARLRCPDAADSDDSGGVDIADPIRSLSFLFLGSRTPAAPFPAPGVDPTEDSLTCLAPSAEEDLLPPRPLSPGEAEAEAASAGQQDISLQAVDGAIEVSPELFDLLSGLGPGENFEGLADFPGLRAFVTAAIGRAPAYGAPIAIPFHLKVPVGPGGCHEIDASKLRGLSRDLGPDPTPDDALAFEVEPETVCGPGSHVVRFTVTDLDGLSSWATTRVELCADGEDCQETVSAPHGASPPSELTQQLNCVWIATKRQWPAAGNSFTRGVYYHEDGRIRSVDETPPIRMDAEPVEFTLTSSGAGPTHKLLVTRSLPECSTPSTNLALLGWGRAILRLNLICFATNDCTIATNPPCAARVAVEGSYEATLKSNTEAGSSCDAPLDSIEALVQEEAKLEVNGSPLFNKAFAIQTGTNVVKRINLEVTGRLGVNGRGLAADVGATHGLSHEVWSRTGRRVGVLRAFSGSNFGIPVTADLTAQGKAELVARGKANGMAATATEAFAIYAVGTSNCPGAGTVFLHAHGGRGAALARAQAEIQDFYRQHTGRALAWPPAGQEGRR